MLSEVEKKFKCYIKSLERELTFLNSQYQLLIYLSDAKHERLREFRYAKYFFRSVINSLFTDVLLISTKLLEYGRSERNIPDFLNFVERHLSLFSPEAIKTRCGLSDVSQVPRRDYNVDSKLVQSDRDRLHSLDLVVTNLKTKRDEYYGHYDKRWFDEPSILKAAAPVTRTEMEQLIHTCFDILSRYSTAFDGNGLSMTATGRIDDADNIFRIIKQHLDAQHRQFNTTANSSRNVK